MHLSTGWRTGLRSCCAAKWHVNTTVSWPCKASIRLVHASAGLYSGQNEGQLATDAAVVKRHANSKSIPGAAAVKTRKGGRHYTSDEDLTILRLRAEGYHHAAIARHLPGRDAISVRNRYVYYLSPGKRNEGLQAPLTRSVDAAQERHGAIYTSEEDARLLQWQAEGKRLSAIARDMGRSVESVKCRVQGFLRSPSPQSSEEARNSVGKDSLGRKRRQFATPMEKLTVVYLRNKLGLSWIDIAKQFPWRNHKVMRTCYRTAWLPQFGDVAVTDPRTWSEDKLKAYDRSRGKKVASRRSRIKASRPSRETLTASPP